MWSYRNLNHAWPDVRNKANGLRLIGYNWILVFVSSTWILIKHNWGNRWEPALQCRENTSQTAQKQFGIWMRLWGGWTVEKWDFFSMPRFEWSISLPIWLCLCVRHTHTHPHDVLKHVESANQWQITAKTRTCASLSFTVLFSPCNVSSSQSEQTRDVNKQRVLVLKY